MLRYGKEPFLECSSKGDKRFSAFWARLKTGKSIEETYQAAKIFEDGSTGLDWREAKGRRCVNQEEVDSLYDELWNRYLDENPDLKQPLIEATGISDIFGQVGHNCQATTLWKIRKNLLAKPDLQRDLFGDNSEENIAVTSNERDAMKFASRSTANVERMDTRENMEPEQTNNGQIAQLPERKSMYGSRMNRSGARHSSSRNPSLQSSTNATTSKQNKDWPGGYLGAEMTQICYQSRRSVFVFGSNLLGIHGRGAAKFAADYHGAVMGVGEGPTGNSYALPSKVSPPGKGREEIFMSFNELEEHIAIFLNYAENNPNKSFKVARIGCNLGGFKDEDVAPLFKNAPANCILPGLWVKELFPEERRLIIAGPRDLVIDRKEAFLNLDRLYYDEARSTEFSVVCGGASGGDRVGYDWAVERKIPVIGFDAEWEKFRNLGKLKLAGIMRNQEMSWYGTDLCAFTQGETTGTANMIQTASNDGLSVRVLPVSNEMKLVAEDEYGMVVGF